MAETPVDAYLALEASCVGTSSRHEYWDGVVRAMGGASLAHNRVARQLLVGLTNRMTGGPCEAFMSDLRVKLTPSRYVYPDVVVACPPEVDTTHRPESLTNPTVIFEVLSSSTAALDRTDKLDGYRALASLTDYVLVDPERPSLDHYARRDDGSWVLRTLTAPDVLRLEALQVELPLAEVFGAEASRQP